MKKRYQVLVKEDKKELWLYNLGKSEVEALKQKEGYVIKVKP